MSLIGRPLTAKQRRLLENVRDGREPFDGFHLPTMSHHGGASTILTSLFVRKLIDSKDGVYSLTDLGRQKLETP